MSAVHVGGRGTTHTKGDPLIDTATSTPDAPLTGTDPASDERLDELIAEGTSWPRKGATASERERHVRELTAAVVSLRTQRDAALREMHARELHHLEQEQESAQLQGTVQRLRQLHTKRQRPALPDCTCSPALTTCQTRLILDAAPAPRRVTAAELDQIIRDADGYWPAARDELLRRIGGGPSA